MRLLSAHEVLADRLFLETRGSSRCPHIMKDEIGPYCGRGFSGGEVSECRRMICDAVSLQQWCLTNDHLKCIYFNQVEPFERL